MPNMEMRRSCEGCILGKIIDLFYLYVLFIISLVTILNLILHRHFHVDTDDKEHADSVLEANTKEVVKDVIFNIRL
jgi:hypothetical protein